MPGAKYILEPTAVEANGLCKISIPAAPEGDYHLLAKLTTPQAKPAGGRIAMGL